MASGDRSYAGASEMSVRELVERASRDLEEQLDPLAGQPPAAPAQEAVAVNLNPLSPQEDVEQVYEWSAVPVVDDAKVMAEAMRNHTEVRFFEYASTLCHDEAGEGAGAPVHQLSATQRGYVHLYRRRKRREYQAETDTMATLLFQQQMLMLKKEIDQTQVAVAEHRRANPAMGW